MQSNSMGRRSSTNPVRISMFDREDKSLTRGDSRRTQTLKPKAAIPVAESSHIPRPRLRASSSDRVSNRGSILKATGKTPLRHGPTTPVTPRTTASKYSNVLTVGTGSNRIHAALPTGPRSVSADRASSLGAKGPRKDIRPLTDKTYQADMLNKIDNYFSVNHCSSMLNGNGSLKPLTLKMFIEVSAYLVKMLDIKQILTISNYVEELPKIAKRLHYPGVITKSWLKTANAMHSWPNVLGWICWLVEICEVRKTAFDKYNLDNLPFLGDQEESNIHKHAFFSMLDFYNAWNDEKLDEEAAMIEKYLQEIEDQQGISNENLNNAVSDLEEDMAKLQAAEDNASKIDEEVKDLQEVLSSLYKDKEMQLSSIGKNEEYIAEIHLETEQISAECNAVSDQIRLQNVQHDELLSVIKEQPMSKADRDKIVNKCREIENYMLQFDEHLQDIQKELYTMDIKLATVHSNLTKAVLTYNNEIFMHLSSDIGVDLEELNMPEKGILQPQIMEVLNSKANLMNNQNELLKQQVAEKERFVELNSNELENLQEKMKLLEDESSDVANMIKEEKRLMIQIKSDTKNEETKLKEQIKILQNDIKEIQDSMPGMQKLATELEEVTDKLDDVQRRKAYIEESAKLFFDKFYEILGEHRSDLYSILTKLNK